MPTFTPSSANDMLVAYKRAAEGPIEHRSTNTYRQESKKVKSADFALIEESKNQSSSKVSTRAHEIRNPHTKIRLVIKNMVSIRCKMIVKSVLAKLGIHDAVVRLGEVDIKEDLSPANREKLKLALRKYGLELLEDKRSRLIEQIKHLVVEMVHYDEELPKTHLSDYLAKRLHHDYSYLSHLFTEVQGTTIEHFLLEHKIEKVKELLVYDDLSLTDISYRLNYSSVAHLCNQFKKVTGLTPSHFRELKHERDTWHSKRCE